MIVALYQVMTSHGKSVEDVIRTACRISENMFDPYSRWILRIAGRLFKSRWAKQYLQKQALQSQERKYPEDWVYSFVEGDGKAFSLGLDFTECAVIKLYEKHGVEDLKPYCHFFDIIMGRAMNLGCSVDPHLGSGGQLCQFRYQWGKETVIPDRLKVFIAR